MLFGVGMMGLFGGYLLKIFNPYHIGFWCPILASVSLLFTLTQADISESAAFSIVFFLYFLNGVDNPNNIRFINAQLLQREKANFFSRYQTLVQIINIGSPLMSSWILMTYNFNVCIILAISLYLLSSLPWLFLKFFNTTTFDHSGEGGIFAGYQEIFSNRNLFRMTLSRIVNNLSCIGYAVSLPIFVARQSMGDEAMFSEIHGISIALTNAGFIITGLICSFILKKHPEFVVHLVNLASYLGCLSCFIAYFSTNIFYLFISSLILGIGIYCFRVSGMSVGQSITKNSVLAHVVLAGDSIVRMSSFLTSLAIPTLVSMTPIIGISPFLALTSLSLGAIALNKQNNLLYLKSLKSNQQRGKENEA